MGFIIQQLSGVPIFCVYLYQLTQQFYATETPAYSFAQEQHIIIPHRCIAGGCSNTHKDEVSLHKWPEDAHFAKIWTNAVKNSRSMMFLTR